MENIASTILNKLELLKKKYPGYKKYATNETPAAKYVRWFNESKGKLNLYDGYNCPECKNRGGFMRVNEAGYETFFPCKCQKIRNVIRNLKRSGLEENVKKMNFKTYVPKFDWQFRVKKVAQKFIKQEKFKWFYICGQNGSGKTHICTAIADEFLKKNLNVQYISWRDEITKLKSLTYNSGETINTLNSLKTVEVLYIDDFLKTWKDSKGSYQFPTPLEISTAFEVLNARYVGKKITIMSSERNLEDLDKIDEATAGRITEMSGIKDFYIQIKRSNENNMRAKLYSQIVEYG